MPKYSVPLRAWIYIHDVEADDSEKAIDAAIHKAWDMVRHLPIDVIPEENNDLELEEHA